VKAVAVALIGIGGYLMYVAYEAIHNKAPATPVTKAKAAIAA
jgi:hypothetical protein